MVYANSANAPGASCSGTPPTDPTRGWELEESLDIEYAHAMAPGAQIILVEACSNSYTDLLAAEQYASKLVTTAGGGDISNSWGSGKFSGEINYDLYFHQIGSGVDTRNIVYFASAGDAGCGADYPSSSPWAISAGGTSINRSTKGHNFTSETCWAGSGGGTSTYETYATSFTGGNTGPWADYQYSLFGQANRATPDISFDADPSTGVNVYSKYFGGSATPWVVVGGTSVASPALAGIVNLAGNKLGYHFTTPIATGGWYTNEEDTLLYSQLPLATYSKNFYDVTGGSNGCTVAASWDYCTGVGSPRGLVGK